METGRDGPVGDIEDLGHLRQGEVEVVVQHEDGALVDVELTQLAEHPLTLGDVAGASGVRVTRGRAARELDLPFGAACPRTCSRPAP